MKKKLFSSERLVRYSLFLFGRLYKQNLLFSSLPIRAFMSILMIWMLRLGMCRWRDDSLFKKVVILVLSLVGLWQEAIIIQTLLLNVAHLILGWVFSLLFNHFKARGLRSIPTPLRMALTEFFHAHAKTNVYPLSVSWYNIDVLARI